MGKNNSFYNSTGGTTGNPSRGTNPTSTGVTASSGYFPFMGTFSTGTINANFGQRPFTYTAPSGFVALNTYNLPDSTIKKGSSYMDATLYTGNGSTQTITNAGAFKPDFVWIKRRDATASHALIDSVRGISNQLVSNLTNAEATGCTDGITSLNSNGFSLGAGTLGYVTNNNGATLVGWQWQAGQGSTSSNTSGSITSTVSVNATAGFSIVQFTATGATATVGHGLGVAPSVVIVKDAVSAGNWAMYHKSLPSAAYYLYMNTTAAQGNTALIWNSTAPTSSVFSIGTWHTADRQIAYCWSEIAGFSKFGSYTGNGSSDGPFVYTGFRPKYIMIKRTDSADMWAIWDTARNTFNVMTSYIRAEASDAEATFASMLIDPVSNGFKLRGANGAINGSSGTYIYMAFAESPFKNSNAR
jgi:hypothetical protein